MNVKKLSIPLAISLGLMAAPLLEAKVDEKTAAKLGTTLTPLGAEKAGNKAGTIPAWTGGITTAPKGYNPKKMHVDPYASDKVLYTVNSDNVTEHVDKLSPGQLAMFKRYPDTFKKNQKINNISKIKFDEDQYLFHAGTLKKNGNIYSNGGRVLNFVSISENFKTSKVKVLKNLEELNWSNGFYRRDIGYKVIKE